MARLGGWYGLSERKVCVGVSPGKTDEEVVCSFANGAIDVYSLHDHGRLHSWTLSSSDWLTCPAVYHPPSGHYCLVRNSQELLCWTESSESLDATPQTLPSNSAHFLLSPSTHPSLVLVYSDGRVGTVGVGGGGGGEVTIVKKITRGSMPKIQLSALCKLGGRESVVLVHTHTGHSYVSCCALGADGVGQPTSVPLWEVRGREVVASCLCGSDLVVLWSDGSLSSYSLHPLASSHPPPSLTPVCHAPLTPAPSTPSFLTAVSGEYFSLGACEEEGGGRVMLCDLAYATCQATSTVRDRFTQLSCIGGFLLAVGSEGVQVCSVEGVREGGLAAALGKAKASGKESQVVLQSWLAPDADCKLWLDELSQQEEVVREYISALSDPSSTPDEDRFMAAFESRPTSRDVSYESVVRRLLSEDGFWGRDVLIQLLEEQLFPLSLSGNLMEAAMERKDWSLISVALTCVDRVPEAKLVDVIKETLSLPGEVESFGSVVRRKDLLFELLSMPKNDSLLQQPLSHVPFPLVLSLLTFLQRHVGVPSLLSLSSPDTRPLPYPTILEWVGLLLDVHFTQLALSPEAKRLIQHLRRDVRTQVIVVQHLAPLCGLTEVWQGEKPYKQPQTDWKYSVDKIELDV